MRGKQPAAWAAPGSVPTAPRSLPGHPVTTERAEGPPAAPGLGSAGRPAHARCVNSWFQAFPRLPGVSLAPERQRGLRKQRAREEMQLYLSSAGLQLQVHPSIYLKRCPDIVAFTGTCSKCYTWSLPGTKSCRTRDALAPGLLIWPMREIWLTTSPARSQLAHPSHRNVRFRAHTRPEEPHRMLPSRRVSGITRAHHHGAASSLTAV